MAKSTQIVGDLAQNIDGQGASADNNEEETRVDQEVARVKNERNNVEDKLLLEPLLSVAKLTQGHLVLEVRFD